MNQEQRKTAFHGLESLKVMVLNRVRMHVERGTMFRGPAKDYFRITSETKLDHVGLIEAMAPVHSNPIQAIVDETAIPRELILAADEIYQNLSVPRFVDRFPVYFVESIQPGADLSLTAHIIAADILDDMLNRLADMRISKTDGDTLRVAITGCLEMHAAAGRGQVSQEAGWIFWKKEARHAANQIQRATAFWKEKLYDDAYRMAKAVFYASDQDPGYLARLIEWGGDYEVTAGMFAGYLEDAPPPKRKTQ